MPLRQSKVITQAMSLASCHLFSLGVSLRYRSVAGLELTSFLLGRSLAAFVGVK